MFETFLVFLTHPFIIMVYGMIMHYIKNIMDEMNLPGGRERIISPLQYWKTHPYQSLFGVLSSLAGFAALYGTDELTKITAFGLGYLSDSVVDIMGSKANLKKKLENASHEQDVELAELTAELENSGR